MIPLSLRRRVPLAPLTTLELGGEAEHFVEARDRATILRACRWAQEEGLALNVLGGGSNVVVPDQGVGGLTVRIATRGITYEEVGPRVRVHIEAGEPWDRVVRETVARGLAGLECLSGIPGLTGATPIQNVGAYGQEIGDTLVAVQALNLHTLAVERIEAERCLLSYRDSDFKRRPGRYVLLAVELDLIPGGEPTLRYGELARAVDETRPSLELVRRVVLDLRAKKSMVIDAADPNRRSAGSFFTNPIVSRERAAALFDAAVRSGVVREASEVPHWPAGRERIKLAAGWLIERSGIEKGMRQGPVGISSAHALALVHHGGGTSVELLALAEEVRESVRRAFGVELAMEPRIFGR